MLQSLYRTAGGAAAALPGANWRTGTIIVTLGLGDQLSASAALPK
jgi:hypothetical protein